MLVHVAGPSSLAPLRLQQPCVPGNCVNAPVAASRRKTEMPPSPAVPEPGTGSCAAATGAATARTLARAASRRAVRCMTAGPYAAGPRRDPLERLCPAFQLRRQHPRAVGVHVGHVVLRSLRLGGRPEDEPELVGV